MAFGTQGFHRLDAGVRPATMYGVKEDRDMRNLTDSTIEVSVTRGSRARLELPAETADRLNLKDGDSIAALIGPTADHIERRVAVESWIDEGTDRDLGHDEFLAWLGSCPDQPA